MGLKTEGALSARAELKQLLRERNANMDRKAEYERIIKQRFEKEVAILALDMTGFSRTTMKLGIIHFLGLIAQMEELAIPAVEHNGGIVIKQEADNLFATFPTPGQAVEAALEIFRVFREVSKTAAEDCDIYGSVGIGFGPTLVIDDEDLFGNEMNLASKLGEDLAESMEILLTENAQAALDKDRYKFNPLYFTISGMELNCYRLEY
jgi:class 3 adenylate cyclase